MPSQKSLILATILMGCASDPEPGGTFPDAASDHVLEGGASGGSAGNRAGLDAGVDAPDESAWDAAGAPDAVSADATSPDAPLDEGGGDAGIADGDAASSSDAGLDALPDGIFDSAPVTEYCGPSWVMQLNATNGTWYGVGLDIAENGDVAVAAGFRGTFQLGQKVYQASSYYDAGEDWVALIARVGPTGNVLWDKIISPSAGAASITFDHAGNSYVVGWLDLTLYYDLGGGVLAPTHPGPGGLLGDMFLLKLGANGAHIWSRRIPTGGWRLVPASDGTVRVVGDFAGAVLEIEPGVQLQNPNSLTSDVAVIHLSANGSVLAADRFGSTGAEVDVRADADANGNTYITGYTSSMFSFGGPSVGPGYYVVKFDATSTHVWTKSLGNCGVQSLAVDPTGAFVLAGDYGQGCDPGNGPLTSAGSSGSFVARYSSAAVLEWVRAYPSESTRFTSAAMDGSGRVYVNGALGAGSLIDLGGGPLQSAGKYDVLRFVLSGAGQHLGSAVYGDVQNQWMLGSAANPSGHVAMWGWGTGTLALPEGTLNFPPVTTNPPGGTGGWHFLARHGPPKPAGACP